MMITIRTAVETDIGFLHSLEMVPRGDRLAAALEKGSIWIVRSGETSVGFLLFSVLWGSLPFLEFFEILASQRGRNFGADAVRAWEREMGSRGFDLVLTSTQADGDAQHFWRRMGYVDCGALTVRSKAAEVFFQRPISMERVD